MKNKLIKEKERMQTLAGLIKENFEKSNIQVWFDLDGVLADMHGELMNNSNFAEYKNDFKQFVEDKFPELLDVSDDEVKSFYLKRLLENPYDEEVKNLKKVFKKYDNYVFKLADREGFYEKLNLMPGAIELIKKSIQITGSKPNIITSPMGDENDPENVSVKEKREWVIRNFGDLINKIEITSDKGRVVKSRKDILIDDRPKYIQKFKNAGGSTILYKSPENVARDLEILYNELINNS